MLTLNDGRSELWQWDTGRKLNVDADCSQVHFSNKVFGRSIDVDVVDSVAIIPDILLQTDKELTAWAFVGTPENGYTKISKVFKVNKRNKPADYVFTPPEQTSIEEILEKIDYLESIQDPDAIKNAVEDYLEQNPVEATVHSVNGHTGEVKLTAKDVGAISKDGLQDATNEALAQAKASGQFDGEDGADGITPHIGANGNWFVGNTDTGKPSRGADGKDGKDGAQGEQGIQGVQGEKGDTGASGKDGSDGKDGKTAYQYAKDGGYTGSESDFALKLAKECPSKVSELTNDKGYITSGEAPVQSVNGETGAVHLTASDVGARSASWMPTAAQVGAVPVERTVNGKALSGDIALNAEDVGARSNTWTPTYTDVGAEKRGTAASAVTAHNSKEDAHNDIRLLIAALTTRLDALANSDDTTLDQMAEVVAYIKDNRGLIEQITTGKVSVADIVNNLTTNVTNKPLSAAQGVALKALIDAITIPTKISQLTNDKGYITSYTETDPTVPSWAKQPNKPRYTSSEVGALPSTTKIPSKTSDLTNDSGFITGYTETDPTVPAWAKNATKPSYSKSEVGLGNVDNVKQYSASNPPPYPVTSVNGQTGDVQVASKFDPTVYRLPVLHLTGDTTGMTKETEVTLSYECNDKDGTVKTGSCTMKWQGSSSLAWDKKNYTIKFDNAFEVVNGWGSQKKYCLKANWIDHSHSRNVVSAKLWGLIRKNRSNLNSKLKALPNAGAIDGFPVVVMLNGEFHGLYSWNIPKDAWMFGMGSGTKEAIVGADNQADDTAFKAETLLDADGWELEYNSSGFSADAVKTSLNNLIKACIDSWGGDLDTTVAQYLDWESAIDYYIFFIILKGYDNITKNTLLATFDGVKWYFSAYDMDSCYGLNFDGSGLARAVSNVNFEEVAGEHRVFELIKRFKTNELKARYKALRADALSESRICNYFENYAWDISSPILVEEVKRWPSVRGSAVNGIDQICRWVRQRLEVTDKWINALPAQETPVEPEKPVEMVNLVPTSIDTDGSIYNGTGYNNNVRLSSSGGVSGTAQDGSVTTGFMPWQSKGIVRIKGATWIGITTGHYYINLYDANKALMYAFSSYELTGDTGTNNKIRSSYDETSGVTTLDFSGCPDGTGEVAKAINNAAYFRINAYGKGADLIITVNQEIT